MRTAEIKRKTNETDIFVKINLDGKGEAKIDTGCGFLDHMLTLMSRHSRIDMEIFCKGDTEIDYHHTTEDIGIALGKAFCQAIGDKLGIVRYGSMLLPMDEALVLAAIDISGRAFLVFNCKIPTQKVGDFDTELVCEFFRAFAFNAGITLNIKQLDGENSHHIIEATFKAVGRALKTALSIDCDYSDEIPSTKGVL